MDTSGKPFFGDITVYFVGGIADPGGVALNGCGGHGIGRPVHPDVWNHQDPPGLTARQIAAIKRSRLCTLC